MGCNLSRHVALFAMENSSLQVEEITVRFGGLVALDRVSATFREREVHGVIGPNGAGKTTLFNVVSGFVKADLGKLSFFGEEVTSHRPEKLSKYGVARTLQGLGLFSRMSVLENVMIGLTSTGKTKGFGGMLGSQAHDSGNCFTADPRYSYCDDHLLLFHAWPKRLRTSNSWNRSNHRLPLICCHISLLGGRGVGSKLT